MILLQDLTQADPARVRRKIAAPCAWPTPVVTAITLTARSKSKKESEILLIDWVPSCAYGIDSEFGALGLGELESRQRSYNRSASAELAEHAPSGRSVPLASFATRRTQADDSNLLVADIRY